MANATSAKTGRTGEPMHKTVTRALHQDTLVQHFHDKSLRRLQSGDIDLPSGTNATRPIQRQGLSVRRRAQGRRAFGSSARY